MKLIVLGGWQQAEAMIQGLLVQQGLFSWLFGPGRFYLVLGVLVLFAWQIISTLKDGDSGKMIKRAAIIIVAIPIYLSTAQKMVPVTLHTPAASAGIAQDLAMARQRVASAEASLTAAKAEPGSPNANAAAVVLANAQGDLTKLESLNVSSGTEVAQASAIFAFIWTITDSIALNLWEVIDKVSWSGVSVRDRGMQAAFAEQLSVAPGLTIAERDVAERLSACLVQKQVYAEQLVKISDYVAKGVQVRSDQDPPLAGKELSDGWAAVVLPSRERAQEVCAGITEKLSATIDASILPEEVDTLLGGFTLDLPMVGKTSFFQPDSAQKLDYLASTIGVPASQLQGKSDAEIARMFLRHKKLQAITDRLTAKLDDVAMTPVAARDAGGWKSTAGGWLAEWAGGFALAAAPFIAIDAVTFISFLLPMGFFFTVLLSFVPGYFAKAYKGFIFGLFFLLVWQVMILTIQKYYAHAEQVAVGMQKPSNGISYAGDLIAATASQLRESIETGTVASAVGASRTAAGRAAISAVLSAASAGGPAGWVTWAGGTGVLLTADAAMKAADKLDKSQAAYAKIFQGEVGLNPALEQLANGNLKVQQQQIKAVRDRLQMNEAVWLIMSPLLTMMVMFGAWFVIGQAASAVAAPVMQMGSQAGSMISNSITNGLSRAGFGKFGGGGGKP